MPLVGVVVKAAQQTNVILDCDDRRVNVLSVYFQSSYGTLSFSPLYNFALILHCNSIESTLELEWPTRLNMMCRTNTADTNVPHVQEVQILIG